jgi:hypothetical protein
MMANEHDMFWPISDDVAIYADAGQVSSVGCRAIKGIKIEGSTIDTDNCFELVPVEI